MKHIRIISRILVGLVFIFSGFVKGIDPMGSAIKFSEYFEIFHMSWLGSASLVLSIMLSTAEFLIGVSLLIGLRMKVTAWGALIFMSFFTLLTLYSAVYNPVTDCGCFGDAFKPTNWQTFYKNVVLIIIVIFIFYSRDKYLPYAKPLYEWFLVIFFASAGAGISIYCYQHLPIMDFRPYSIGTYIPEKMVNPPGTQADQYETILYYEKNGVVKEFPVINNKVTMPDSTWTFKDSKSKLVKQGEAPPIHGFSINTANGDDIASIVLADTSYSFVFITHDATKVPLKLWQKIQDYYLFSVAKKHKFYVLTSTPKSLTDEIKDKFHLIIDFYYTDETTLKTIIRSNPGLVLLRQGTVLGMWHYNDFPSTGYFSGNIMSKVLTDYNKSMEWGRIIMLSLGFLLVIMTLLVGKIPIVGSK